MAFGRPTPFSYKREELHEQGASIIIHQYAVGKEGFGGNKVISPGSGGAKELVLHHACLLLKCSTPHLSVCDDNEESEKSRVEQKSAVNPAVEAKHSKSKSKTKEGFTDVKLWEKKHQSEQQQSDDSSEPPDQNNDQTRQEEAAAAKDVLLLRLDWNAASRVWHRVLDARSDIAACIPSDQWRTPMALTDGNPRTVADVPHPWGWYELRVNNCQHFVARTRRWFEQPERKPSSKCAIS